jgi:hypothetical protein
VIFSTLLGGLLARRFNVLVLFPAMLVGVALGAGVVAVGGISLLETLPVLGCSFAGLQVGFVANCVLPVIDRRMLEHTDDVKVAGPIQPQDGELEAARQQLDKVVPELMALSRQMAVPGNAEPADRPAAVVRSKAS